MGVNKRFYWLKLPSNFYSQISIKKLKRHGYSYVVIYQEMLLMSLETNGEIYYENVEETIQEEIAFSLDEEIEDVSKTIELCEKMELLEVTEYGLKMLKIEEMTGSETSSSIRSRKSRALQCNIKALQCNTNATPLQHREEKRREEKSREDIEIEKELEIDTKKKNKRKNFVKPTVQDVQAYCSERNNNIDAQSFIDFYESKGWLVGKTPMKDWKASVRTWERRKPNLNNKNTNDTQKEDWWF